MKRRARKRSSNAEFYSAKVLYPAMALLIVLTALGLGLEGGPLRRLLQGAELVGEVAPSFDLPVIRDGVAELDARVTPSAYRGKWLVLEFWASWCPPCAESIPALGGLLRQEDKLRAIAINVEPHLPLAKVSETFKAFGGTFPTVQDRGGEIAAAYHVESLPVMVIVDPQGVVRGVHNGLTDAAVIQEKLAALMRAPR